MMAPGSGSYQAEVEKIELERDRIEFNGIAKTKKELAQDISDEMSDKTNLPSELADLISRIEAVCRTA